jgi:NAD-dependent dihydropyrimidine dehydrogenase PreA subunit
MPFVIADPCIDVTDKSCMEECPVDCIYEGVRKLYINPFECIDCGACEPACPVEAITEDRHVEEGSEAFVEDSVAFFTTVLPGREEPIGEQPGGASSVGAVGADTELVAAFTARGDA